MSESCLVCGVTDAYSKLKDRVRCFVCQIRHYQQIQREQGMNAVLEEARMMGSGNARGASAPFDILTVAAGREAAGRMRG
jgi:hypothetical protein